MKTSSELFDLIGVPLKIFLREHYGTQKRACRSLNVQPALMSKVIRGVKKAPIELQKRLEEKGFDATLFYHYIDAPKVTESISVSETMFIIGELKRIILDKEFMLKSSQFQINNLEKELFEAREKYRNLKKIVKSRKLSEIVEDEQF